MDNAKKDLPEIETPIETTDPKVGPAATHAAGAMAVYSSMKYAVEQMGPVRTAQTLLRLNHKGGFDCPSCAWPDPDDHRAVAEFCENGARAVADEATLKRVTPEFFAAHSLVELSKQSDFELNQHGRITHPMIKRPGDTHYRAFGWDETFALIAHELRQLESPNQASFYTSGRASNEAAFLYQLFVRMYGTNNLPDCSNMCHESSGSALGQQIGVGKGTVTLEDLHLADCILVIGQNPGTNHPRMLSALQKAVRRGAKIISVNPLSEAGLVGFANPQEIGGMLGLSTPLADLHLPVRINGDVAVAKGLLKCFVDAEDKNPGQVFDHAFIKEYTHGLEALLADTRAAAWEEIVAESGVDRQLIERAAEMMLKSKGTVACWAMGLTQHKNAVANIQMYGNLLLLRGDVGKPGAGFCPVRGHSNVQGDRTMGIFEKMPEWFMDGIAKEFKFEPPREHGLDAVATLKAMHSGDVKVLFALGGNFMSATPDTNFVAEGMRRCRLTVHVSTKINRAHLVTGETAIILPCLGRTERDDQAAGPQFVTVEDSMSVVHSSEGRLEPGSPLMKSEVAIIAGLARAVFADDAKLRELVDWEALAGNYDLIRDHIERVVPGFANFNERVRRPGGFYLPNGPKDSRTFKTPTGKANFMVAPIAKTSLPDGRYRLMTIRSHDQFNTTIYGLNDRYRGVEHGRRVVLMSPEDIKKRGFKGGARVDITSHFKGETRTAAQFVIVPYDIPTQCLAVYYPEGNPLVAIDSVADISNTPAYKSIEVTLATAKD